MHAHEHTKMHQASSDAIIVLSQKSEKESEQMCAPFSIHPSCTYKTCNAIITRPSRCHSLVATVESLRAELTDSNKEKIGLLQKIRDFDDDMATWAQDRKRLERCELVGKYE